MGQTACTLLVSAFRLSGDSSFYGFPLHRDCSHEPLILPLIPINPKSGKEWQVSQNDLATSYDDEVNITISKPPHRNCTYLHQLYKMFVCITEHNDSPLRKGFWYGDRVWTVMVISPTCISPLKWFNIFTIWIFKYGAGLLPFRPDAADFPILP